MNGLLSSQLSSACTLPLSSLARLLRSPSAPLPPHALVRPSRLSAAFPGDGPAPLARAGRGWVCPAGCGDPLRLPVPEGAACLRRSLPAVPGRPRRRKGFSSGRGGFLPAAAHARFFPLFPLAGCRSVRSLWDLQSSPRLAGGLL